jgi:energy-coupling factor transport system permease protein
MLLSEMQQIRATQTLRGARLLLADVKHPRHWPDWVRCLLVPVLIKTLSLSGEIATAAKARDFGIQPQRTAWPEE